MKEEWFKLYEEMLQQMENCSRFRMHTMEGIECCFNMAQKYWTHVQQKLEEHPFLSKGDEIRFYKGVKPLFKSQIEFYNLLYQSEILKPHDEPGAMKEFWIREQLKLEIFIQDNFEFYSYYKNGSTNRDEEYFLSGVAEDENGKAVYPDDLIATLMALERYALHAKSELSLC